MQDEFVEMQLVGIGQDLRGSFFVLLRDHLQRDLPIWIGHCEALAIRMKIEREDVPRPMTHDLLLNTIERLGGKVEQLVIDDLWQNTFYAKIFVSLNGNQIPIDCRPSDGIALALRAEVPILVSEGVIAEGQWRESEGDEQEDEEDLVE